MIKVFDRLHNTQTIGAKSPEKIKNIVGETAQSFLAICTYLGYIKLENYLYKLFYNSICREHNTNELEITY
ncbi:MULTISPECIES: hypothetical protein [unclassified Candidatus Tisiphia]|uniref:hypothetical protein n=1 Tax=unclassified Candidatus Tisiphia TaxID=2996318 RepID=UPI003CCAFD1C